MNLSVSAYLLSKGSVILMLIIVLMMEGPRRGLFFGK